MRYSYYYNDVPGLGPVRNNLIYTSLISEDKKVFVQWFHNDTDYHRGKNQIVDNSLMDIKWEREVKFLSLMYSKFPDLVPKILDIDHSQKKIFLQIDGHDFWQQHYDKKCTYDDILPDWQEQILTILKAHKHLGLFKYSLHPSSYFITNGKLKSINYFFSYHANEPLPTLEEHRSHISLERQEKMIPIMQKFNISWDSKVPYEVLQLLCFESFRSNYPDDFIEKCKLLYA